MCKVTEPRDTHKEKNTKIQPNSWCILLLSRCILLLVVPLHLHFSTPMNFSPRVFPNFKVTLPRDTHKEKILKYNPILVVFYYSHVFYYLLCHYTCIFLPIWIFHLGFFVSVKSSHPEIPIKKKLKYNPILLLHHTFIFLLWWIFHLGYFQTVKSSHPEMVIKKLNRIATNLVQAFPRPRMAFSTMLVKKYTAKQHGEKPFLNLIKLTRNQIVFIIFRFIWNQTDDHLNPNQSQMVNTIWFRVDLIRFRKDLCVWRSKETSSNTLRPGQRTQNICVLGGGQTALENWQESHIFSVSAHSNTTFLP